MRKLIPLILLILPLQPLNAAGVCQPLIDSCRTMSNAKDKTIADTNAALQAQIEATSKANAAANADSAQLDKWYRNPVLVGVLGFAIGGLAGVYVSKH